MAPLFSGLKNAAADFMEDDCMSSGAAIAYYSVFSLPPLLVIVFFAAGWLGVDKDRINEVVKKQIGMPTEIASPDAPDSSGGEEDQAEGLGAVANRTEPGQVGGLGTIGKVIGVLFLVFSATGLFAQLQYALNKAWEVEPDPEQGGVMSFVLKRVFSLGMIVVMAFLLLVSLVLTTFVDEITGWVSGGMPAMATQATGYVLNSVVTLLVATLLFGVMFKILPDVKMAWRDVWVGAACTALLFVIGKALIGWYLQNSDMGGSWGSAAASMVGVLVWVYYTSLIVLFGAEVTQVWAKEHGSGIKPAEGAVRKVEEKRLVRDEG